MNCLKTIQTHTYTMEPNNSDDRLSKFMDEYVEFVSFNLYEIFPKEYDAKIADAILELYSENETISMYSIKRHFTFIYTR
jgi:hypothetical protein